MNDWGEGGETSAPVGFRLGGRGRERAIDTQADGEPAMCVRWTDVLGCGVLGDRRADPFPGWGDSILTYTAGPAVCCLADEVGVEPRSVLCDASDQLNRAGQRRDRIDAGGGRGWDLSAVPRRVECSVPGRGARGRGEGFSVLDLLLRFRGVAFTSRVVERWWRGRRRLAFPCGG